MEWFEVLATSRCISPRSPARSYSTKNVPLKNRLQERCRLTNVVCEGGSWFQPGFPGQTCPLPPVISSSTHESRQLQHLEPPNTTHIPSLPSSPRNPLTR